MKILKSVLFISLIILYAEASAGSNNNSTYLSGKSKIVSTMSYLGMSEQQYIKFHAAVRGSVKAELLDSGLSYNDNAAVLEFKKLLAEKQPIPGSLAMEVEELFIQYRTDLAKYSELTLEEFEIAEKKLVHIDMSYVELNSISNGNVTTSSSDEDKPTVEIIRREDKVEESSSGDHYVTIAEIHDLGQPFLRGIGVNISVQFTSPTGANLGTQSWRVTNTHAWPTGNIKGGALLPH